MSEHPDNEIVDGLVNAAMSDIECAICEELNGEHHEQCPKYYPSHIDKLRAHITALEAAGRALLEWDKKYPLDYKELTALIERFRGLLEPTEPDEERWKHPPCMECGAMTAKEAETKCRCAGDKDHCHGCELWPEG